jgi:hypothetical protein
MGSKNTTKNVLQKNPVEGSLQKNRQKSKPDFFRLRLFYHAFGRFSARGVQRHHKKSPKSLTLVLFWPLIDLPTPGVPFFFFGGPVDGQRRVSFFKTKTGAGDSAVGSY